MVFRVLVLGFCAVFALAAADKKPAPEARGENLDLILTVTLYTDPAAIKDLTGFDLEGHYYVAAVKIEPKYGKEVVVSRDDFTLFSNKDGEKTTPFAASQVAGTSVLVVTHGKSPGAASPGMVMAGPLILQGGGAGIGTPEGDKPAEVKEEADQKKGGDDKKESPLKKALTDKALPEVKTGDTVSGLVYFPMEKQKVKDLELWYGGRENRITLRFK